jgi:hypothetical protein
MGGCHLDQVELGEIERRLGQAPAPGVDIEHSDGKLGVEGSKNAVAHFALRDGSGGRGLAMSNHASKGDHDGKAPEDEAARSHRRLKERERILIVDRRYTISVIEDEGDDSDLPASLSKTKDKH